MFSKSGNYYGWHSPYVFNMPFSKCTDNPNRYDFDKYYSDIKDRLFFVDGMNYDSGTMTSSADCHVSSLNITNSDAAHTADASVSDMSMLIERAYTDYVDAIPRNASYIQDTAGEWIADLSFSIVSSRVSENQIVHDETSLSAAEIVVSFDPQSQLHSVKAALESDLPPQMR